MRNVLDIVAEQVRLAYAQSEKETNPRMFIHITKNAPWSTLSDERKAKWISMAEVAWNMCEEHHDIKGGE